MPHTIYAANFEQMIIHQLVHLRRESQSHDLAHVQMRLYPIDKSLVFYKGKEGGHVRIMTIAYNYVYLYAVHQWCEFKFHRGRKKYVSSKF
jgi:hypothetical protein